MFFAEEDKKIYDNTSAGIALREFVMPFVDASGQEAFKLNKTRSVTAHTKCCCPCCCCFTCDFCWKGFLTTCCGVDNDQAE